VENICLDTDFLVNFLRNKKEAVEFIETNELKNHLATTYINLFELYHGVMKSHEKENNLVLLENLQNRITILNLSKESVREAGKLLAGLEKDGKPIDFRDLLIGTVALVEGFSIKTDNKKHFDRVNGLNVH